MRIGDTPKLIILDIIDKKARDIVNLNITIKHPRSSSLVFCSPRLRLHQSPRSRDGRPHRNRHPTITMDLTAKFLLKKMVDPDLVSVISGHAHHGIRSFDTTATARSSHRTKEVVLNRESRSRCQRPTRQVQTTRKSSSFVKITLSPEYHKFPTADTG
jgi:hypothetical protein